MTLDPETPPETPKQPADGLPHAQQQDAPGAPGEPAAAANEDWLSALHAKVEELHGLRDRQQATASAQKVQKLSIAVDIGGLLTQLDAQGINEPRIIAGLAARGAKVDRVSLSRHRSLYGLAQRLPLRAVSDLGYTDALQLLRVRDAEVQARLFESIEADPKLRASRLVKQVGALRVEEPGAASTEAGALRQRHLGTARKRLERATQQFTEAMAAGRAELRRAAQEGLGSARRGATWQAEARALRVVIAEASRQIQAALADDEASPAEAPGLPLADRAGAHTG
jgi:hypothetical protein